MSHLVQDRTVRYGFKPQRALYLLVALIAAVTLALSTRRPNGTARYSNGS